jgi:hypothetical protein
MKLADKYLYQLSHDVEMIKQVETFKCLAAVDKIPPGVSNKIISYSNPRFKNKVDENGQTTYHCRITYGGDKGSTGDFTFASTSTMEEAKMFLQGVVTDGAHVSAIDIVAFFLNTPLTRYVYMRMPYAQLSPRIIQRYGWQRYEASGFILFEVRKAMYGMDDAARKSFQLLEHNLRTDGYCNTERNPNLFRHRSNGVAFTLVVDDLCVKWQTEAALEHLLSTLRKNYGIKVQRTLKKYIGFTINYNEA